MLEILIGVAAGVVTLVVALLILLWLWARRQPEASKEVVKRALKLPLGAKFRLVARLLGDRRVPLWVRAILPLLVLYLAIPLDVIPDFLPVVGHLDDALVLLVGVALFVRFTPLRVVEPGPG
jgi:uncharacterized membrane protein YkvA (DUF1232 family)